MTIQEATQEYHALLQTGMGLPAIVKALDIPPMFVSRNYSDGGIYTEPYVIEQIDKLLSGLTD